MSSTVQLYPGAEAYLRNNSAQFSASQWGYIQRYVAERRDAYQAAFAEFEIAHAMGQASASTHQENNLKRLAELDRLQSPQTFKNLEGADQFVTNFLYTFEKKMISDDNAQISQLYDPTLKNWRDSGLIPTEHVVLGHDQYPVTPQTDAFRPTDRAPLGDLPEVTPAPRPSLLRQSPAREVAEDISFRERTPDGEVTDTVDVNALATRAVRNFVDAIEVPATKPLAYPASLFEPGQPRFSDEIKHALDKANGAMAYVQKVRKDMATMSAEDAQAYLQDKLEPDRLYVLSQLEKTGKSSEKFGVLQGLDGFLKQQMAKVQPVSNPTFTTEAPQASAPAPAAAKPVIHVARSPLQEFTQDELLERSRAHSAMIDRLKNGPLNKYLEDVLLPEKSQMDMLMLARKRTGHSSSPLLETHSQYLGNLVARAEKKIRMIPTLATSKIIVDSPLVAKPAPQPQPGIASAKNAGSPSIFTEENKQTMEIVRNGTTEERFHLLNKLRLDHEDTFKQFQSNKLNGVSFEENRQVADQLSFLRAEMGSLKSHLERAYLSAKAPAPTAEIAKPVAQTETQEISFLKPEKKSFFSRIKERLSSAVESVTESVAKFIEAPNTRRAAIAGIFGLVAVGGAHHLMNDTSTDPLVSKNTPEASVKSEPLPITENAFTVIVPPDTKPATAPATADTVSPVLKVDNVDKTEKAAPAKTARADFLSKSTEPYKMPDDLKVTFNGGSSSRFGKDTWQKACDQLKATGTANTFYDEPGLKNG